LGGFITSNENIVALSGMKWKAVRPYLILITALQAGISISLPAYDIAYSYNPQGSWTRDHQMSLAGKRNEFSHADLLTFASNVGLKEAKARQVIDNVSRSVAKWETHAEKADVNPGDIIRIEKTFRLKLRGK